MAFQIVLLSGSVASGKTALWQQLTKSFPAERIHVLRTKNVLRELASKKLGGELPAARRAMQDFGDQLDRDTGGQWGREARQRLVYEECRTARYHRFVVAAVRILSHGKAKRAAF